MNRIQRRTVRFDSFDASLTTNRVRVAVGRAASVRVEASPQDTAWSAGSIDFYAVGPGGRRQIAGRSIAAGGGAEILEEADLTGVEEIEAVMNGVAGSSPTFVTLAFTLEEPQA
ncbi:MAG: hypothetical protein AB7O32_00210 [Vicinamibacterales bacterium]